MKESSDIYWCNDRMMRLLTGLAPQVTGLLMAYYEKYKAAGMIFCKVKNSCYICAANAPESKEAAIKLLNMEYTTKGIEKYH